MTQRFNPQSASRPASAFRGPVAVIAVGAIALVILGLVALFSATAGFSRTPYFYVIKQVVGVVMAAGVCVFVSRLDLESMRRYVWIIAGVAVLLLVLTAVPGLGVKVNGSRRWLGFGPARFQVSEFTKLAMVFCLAHYLALNQSQVREFRRGFLYPVLIVGLFGGLVLLQPDYGTAALTLAVGGLLIFLADVRWAYILGSIPLALGGLGVMVMQNENRMARLLAFMDLEGNRSDGTYQLYNSLAAFAVGGTNGVGIGQGRQQASFLPEAHTDFIFAVIGEEMGLGITLAVVVVFAVLFLLGLLHLRRAPNLFQFLLVAGTILLIALQAVINLGVVTGILPTKGMSLPFISAGLSNLLLMGMLIGVLFNTNRNWERPAFLRPRRGLMEGMSA